MANLLNQNIVSKSVRFIFSAVFLSIIVFPSTFVFAQDDKVVLIKQDAISLHGDVTELEQTIQNNTNLRKDIVDKAVVELVIDVSYAKDQAYIDAATAKVRESLKKLGMDHKNIKIKFIAINWEQNLEEVGHRFSDFLQNNPTPSSFDEMVEQNRLDEKDASLNPEEKVSRKIVHNFTQLISGWYLGTVEASKKIAQTPPTQLIKNSVQCTSGCVARLLKGIVYEAKYIGSAYKRSLQKPDVLSSSVALGTRIPSAFTSTVETFATYSQAGASMVGMGVHMGVGLTLNFGHGIITPIWVNAQRLMVEERGKIYQAIFDFNYGQFWSIFFRMNAYFSGLPNTTPDLNFFATSMGTALIGSTSMSLGYQGINDFSEKKDLHSFTINSIQILRDTLFTVCMNRLGMGDTQGFAIIFAAAQAVSLGLYAGGKIVNYNTKIVFTDDKILKTEEFRKAYPAAVKTEVLKRSSIRKWIDAACSRIWKN